MVQSKAQNDFKKHLSDLKVAINRYGNKTRMKQLGEYSAYLIVIRSRIGKGFENSKEFASDLKTVKFPKLSKNYKKFRESIKLDPTTTAGTSNITLTGQLLRSIGVVKVEPKKVFIGATEENRLTLSNKPSKVKNSEVIEHLIDQSRVFLQLSALDIKKVLRMMNNILRIEFKKFKF